MNNEVKQAFAISDTEKQLALKLYEQAVVKLVNKHYVMQDDDAHTELSAIFGVDWLQAHNKTSLVFFSAKMYAQANIAFNYANLMLGVKGMFVKTAQRLVKANERVSDLELTRIALEMNCLLTFTKAEDGVIWEYL